MKYIFLLLPSLCWGASPLKTVMYNSSGIVASCSNGLKTDSLGRVNGCASGTPSSIALTAGSTSTISAAAIVPFDIRVASGDAVNASTITITNGTDLVLYSSYTYQMRYNVQAGTNSINVGINFGGCDLGANYENAGLMVYVNSGTGAEQSTAAKTLLIFPSDSGVHFGLTSSRNGGGKFDFMQEYGGDGKTILVKNGSSSANNSADFYAATFAGRYFGSGTTFSAGSTFCLTTSKNVNPNTAPTTTGAMNVHWEIWQLGQHN